MSEVRFVDWQESPVLYKPTKFLDKLRWKLVYWLGGACPYDTIKVTHVSVDGITFMERLWKQRRSLVESFRREPTTLLMGSEDYHE